MSNIISTIIERATSNDPSLTKVKLSGISTTDAATLASALARNTFIKKLTLFNTPIMREGVFSIASALEENTTLQEFAFYASDRGDAANNIGDAEALSLASLLRSNKSLQTLSLIGNDIGPERAALLALALRKNKTLKSLLIRVNNIGDEGAAAFASALYENKTLESLDLTNNKIGAEGAVSLANVLRDTSLSLQELSMSFNRIGSRGAASIASALRENTSLRTLDLSTNKVGDEGVSSIASALRGNTTLQSIELNFNGISNDGAALLSSALQENTTVTELKLDDLDDNLRVRSVGGQKIEAFISRNKKLKRIDQTSKRLKKEYNMRSGQGLIDSINDLNGNQNDFESILFVLLLEMPEIMERAYYERIRKRGKHEHRSFV